MMSSKLLRFSYITNSTWSSNGVQLTTTFSKKTKTLNCTTFKIMKLNYRNRCLAKQARVFVDMKCFRPSQIFESKKLFCRKKSVWLESSLFQYKSVELYNMTDPLLVDQQSLNAKFTFLQKFIELFFWQNVMETQRMQ